MIRVTPTSPAGRALALVVDNPGELDAEAIGRHLWPPPKLTSTAGYLAWRRANAEHVASSTARAARLLGRLVEAGLVEHLRPPMVADWFHLASAKHGAMTALRRAHPAYPAGVADLHGLLRALTKVEDGPPVSGAAKRRRARLVEMGVLVAPSMRWPSPAGSARVAEWVHVNLGEAA